MKILLFILIVTIFVSIITLLSVSAYKSRRYPNAKLLIDAYNMLADNQKSDFDKN